LVGALRQLGLVTKHNYGDLGSDRLKDQIYREWGSVLEAGTCPVWVSEFGCALSNEQEMRWFKEFVALLKAFEADWAYWPLNVGFKPGTDADEAYGMLSTEWTPTEDIRLQEMRAIGLTPQEVPRPGGLTKRKNAASKEDLQKLFGNKNPLRSVGSLPSLADLNPLENLGLANWAHFPTSGSPLRKPTSVGTGLAALSGDSSPVKGYDKTRGSCPAALSALGGVQEE
jgi:hypothetical protein